MMDYRIETKEAFTVVGFQRHFHNETSYTEIPAWWSEMMAKGMPLDGEFGLSDAFAPAAIYYLAAMLVLDENEEMSESFLARYSDQLATLRASLPMGKEHIRDHYPDLA